MSRLLGKPIRRSMVVVEYRLLGRLSNSNRYSDLTEISVLVYKDSIPYVKRESLVNTLVNGTLRQTLKSPLCTLFTFTSDS
jgi:hypothetical protein